MTDGLMAQGLQLMLVGMGTVFVFLTALVFATTLMSRLVAGSGTAVPASDTARPPGGPSDEELAAIAAAINLHRRR